MKETSTATRRKHLPIFLIVVVTVLVYAQVLDFGFVSMDDPEYVSENPQVLAGLTLDGVRWAFTDIYLHNWAPLTLLSYMLICEWFGPDPAAYHAASLLLHLCNVLLLYGLLSDAFGSKGRAGWVAALFALHPLHAESVAWISELKDVLSTAFWLLSTWAYVAWTRRPGAARYLLVVLLFALGLAAKSMLVTLPFTLLLLDYWPLRRLESVRDVWPRIVEKFPLFALAAGFSVATVLAQDRAMVPDTLPLHLRAANALWSYVAYLGQTVWPSGLSPFYPHPYLPDQGGETLGPWRVVAAAATLVAITGIVVRSGRRYALVGWLWYLGTLVPVIGLVQVGAQAMADRYTYVPLIGVFVALVWAGAEVTAALESRSPGTGRALRAASLLIPIVLAAVSWQQVRHWRDSASLWERALAAAPGAKAHLGLGFARRAEGRHDEAIAHFRHVYEIAPTSTRALNELGRTFEAKGDLEAAETLYRQSISMGPHSAKAHLLLGGLLERKGDLEGAIEHYRAALEVRPRMRRARTALDEALARQRGPGP